jgi:hypothetical protein
MKKIYFEKKGRRYVPVCEYDNELLDSFPKGTHLVMCYPGGSSRRFNIDPAYASMIAAGRVAEEAISKRIMEATELRRNSKMRQTPLTVEQKAAWDRLVEVFGDDAKQLEWPSAREAAEEAVKAMMSEAEKLMSHESVRKAYDHFILMCELVKENGEKIK